MPRWKIACHERLLPPAALAEKWALAAATGFDGIELAWRVGRETAGRLREVSRAVADGAVVATVALDVSGVDQRPYARVIEELPDIAALGSGIALTLPVDDLAPGDGDSGLVVGLRALADAAGRDGMSVCVRPLNRYEGAVLCTLEQAAALCRAVAHPAVRIAASTFHMNIEEADPPRALLEAGPWLGHIHAADSTRHEPGAGHVDWWATFAALDAAGYAGWIGVDGRPSGPAAAALRAAIGVLRQAGS